MLTIQSVRVELSIRQLAEIRLHLAREGNLVQIAQKTGVKYTTLKQWLNGHRKSLSALNIELLSKQYPGLVSILSNGTLVELRDYQKKGGRLRAQSVTKKQMARVRQYKKDETRLPSLDEPGALEFYGAMMGDGCISCYYSKYDCCNRQDVILYGNLLKDTEYFEYLRLLVLKLFNVRTYLKTVSARNTLVLTIRNLKIANWLIVNGFPKGVKGQLKIPSKVIVLPFDRLRYLLRGFFDTDGSLSARKGEKYRYPYVFLTTTSGPLRRQFKAILAAQGYPVWETKNSVSFRGISATKKWFNEVGSSNPRNMNRYKRWLSSKRLDQI